MGEFEKREEQKNPFVNFDNDDREAYLGNILAIFFPHYGYEETQIILRKFPIYEEDYNGEKFYEYVSGLMALNQVDNNRLTWLEKCRFLNIAIEKLSKYQVPLDAVKITQKSLCFAPHEEEATEEEDYL